MKDYYEMLNRRKPMEEIGDAFKGQADAMKPMNVGQRREQALMRGVGAGINMGARAADEAKIRELQGYSKQLAEQDMMLKITAGKNQQIKAENENFFLTNRNDLATLNDFLTKGDFEAVNVMAPTLIENYKKITGREIGEYAYSRDGKVYLDNGKGEVKGMYLADIFQGIIPEAEQMNFPELLTYNSKTAVQGKMEEMRLKNEQIKAQIESLKAHGELYKAKGIEAISNAQTPKLSKKDELTLKTNITSNRKYIEEKLKPKLEANINILSTYDRLGNIAKENPNLVGSDYLTKVRRTIGEALGLDPALDYAKLSSIEFEKMLKPILGAQLGKDEGDRVLAKFPSIERNLSALKQFLKEERPKLIKNIVKQQAELNTYNKDNSANILDENLLGDLNSEYKNYLTNRYDNTEILVDTNSKEYQLYKDKGGIVE